MRLKKIVLVELCIFIQRLNRNVQYESSNSEIEISNDDRDRENVAQNESYIENDRLRLNAPNKNWVAELKNQIRGRLEVLMVSIREKASCLRSNQTSVRDCSHEIIESAVVAVYYN